MVRPGVVGRTRKRDKSNSDVQTKNRANPKPVGGEDGVRVPKQTDHRADER